VENSPQGTRYCCNETITALGCEADYWFVKRNGQPVAGLTIITDNAAASGLPIHSYYVGIMFHVEAWNCKANRRTENVLAITEAVMLQLSQHYDEIQFCLHPDISDVRGFDWFNYHTPEKGRVFISPRYTAQVMLDDNCIRKSARSSRRREEGYADTRENLHFTTDGSVEELISLWQKSLSRQSSKSSESEIIASKNFAHYVLQNKLGIIATTRDANNTAQTAGLLMFDYNQRAHLPVVGTSDTKYGGTLLYFSIMDYAAAQGYKILDFNGANSPNRAYFKHSIGGDSQLYFYVAWNKFR